MNVEQQGEVEMYDAIYGEYRTRGDGCRVSCAELWKARRNLRGVIRAFGLPSLAGLRALDIGCGLGNYSEALRLCGADVTAIDSSPVAVEIVRETYPRVDARLGSFPRDCPPGERYDLIWACDFSLLNTFEIDAIHRSFVAPAAERLNPGGYLIIGWHSRFDGTMGETHWAHWSLEMIHHLKSVCALQGPRVVAVPTASFSHKVIIFCRMLKKSIPIYFALKKILSSEKREEV